MDIRTKAALDFLEMHKDDNNFYTSLWKQWLSKKHISEKQVQCLERGMNELKKKETPLFSYHIGQEITIKQWMAHRLKTDLNMPYFFRNLRIEEVLNETAKAIQVKVSFVSDIRNCCHVCGADLNNEISLATGIGPVCAKNIGFERPTLARAKEIREHLEKVCKEIGTVGPIWIAKSQLL